MKFDEAREESVVSGLGARWRRVFAEVIGNLRRSLDARIQRRAPGEASR